MSQVTGVVVASARGMLEVLDRVDELSIVDAWQGVVRRGGAMDLTKVAGGVVVNVVMMKSSMAWGSLTMGAIANSTGGSINQSAV